MQSASVVTITDQQLARHLQAATAKLSACTWSVDRTVEQPAVAVGGRRFAFRPLQSLDGAISTSSSRSTTFSLAQRIQDIDPADDLYSDAEHFVLRALRRGLQVALEIRRSFAESAGLDRLESTKEAGELTAAQREELRDKRATAAVASLFGFAGFVVAQLEGYGHDDGSGVGDDVEPPDGLALDSSSRALRSALHYLHEAVGRQVRDDGSLIAVLLACCRQIAERVRQQSESLQHLELYARHAYRIEPDGVTLHGFELDNHATVSSVPVQAKSPEEIVGNHIAKFEATRLAQRLVCYDFARQMNPFVELGGFSFTFIGDGMPGTGKTTLIQMMVTTLQQYCERLDVPFRYANFSVDEISDYQGRSGHNAKRFCQSVMDPKVIALGTIDDVDQVCGNRSDKNVSAGQLEVTAVFMQEFAGPGTIVRGNCSFGLFSNYPEKVDDALRQRTQARFLVDGPKSRDDFTDLLYLLLGSCGDIPLGRGYEPFSAQKIQRVIRDKYEQHNVPKLPTIRRIFDDVSRRGTLSSWVELGEFLHALQKHDARFTGRAIKNIADSVKFRMMNFDLPAEWFDEPDRFFRLPYDSRLDMLRELMGTVTPQMVVQEINRYADSEERYANEARTRELDERTKQIVVDSRARLAAARELES